MQNIAILSDSNSPLEGIVQLLQKELPDDHIALYYTSQDENLNISQQNYDLIIVDIGEKIFDLVSYHPTCDVKIAAIASEDENYVLRLFQLGLNGYLSKGIDYYELVYAVDNMIKGYCYISPDLSNILIKNYIQLFKPTQSPPEGLLTDREYEILQLIANGYSTKQIADHLFISSGTANNHTVSIYKKLNVTDRTNAAIMAIRKGWVNIF